MMTNLTVQNATREGARMAATLIDLQENDPRVLSFVDGLIPNDGPFAGFTVITNTGNVDCETSALITVSVHGQYNLVALNFLGLNGIDVEYPSTTHYELCGVFPVSDTAVPTAATLTPSPTGSVFPTATPTGTPSRTPTPTQTLTPSRTPTTSQTPTRTPTASATVASIDPPIWVGGSYSPSGSACYNINLSWDADNDWSATNPGFAPSTYARYINGVSYGTQSANYPNTVSWSSGFDIFNGQTAVFEFIAQFTGGLTSRPLWKSWTCVNGSMVGQPTPTPTTVATQTPTQTSTRTPTPSRTPTSSNTATRTSTATITPTPSRTPTPSNTPTRTATPSRTPTRTPTTVPPDAPIPVDVNWTTSGTSCTNIQAIWDANNNWATYPGFGPTSYDRLRNGISAGLVAANYPNNVTWNTGDTLINNQSRTYGVEAVFSGGLRSLRLSALLTCVNGNIVADLQ